VSASAVDFDQVHDAREVFLACLWAQCAPGTPSAPIAVPRLATGEVDTAAAVLVSLLDPGLGLAAVGSDEVADVARRVREITSAHAATVAAADFVLVAGGATSTAVGDARRGSALEPERGATLVVCADPGVHTEVVLRGPGLAAATPLVLPLAPDVIDARAAANVSPPAGVDLFVVRGRSVIALPRSTEILRTGL
jgi:alpha-D-ribose 1-methylphosphonate 5-triphosphate synthase subunit PhnH